MTPLIDISKLEHNEATRPFHVAAGLQTFENAANELSYEECLLYQVHQTRPDTYLSTASDATKFLSRLPHGEQLAIARRAKTMCGEARSLVERARRVEEQRKTAAAIQEIVAVKTRETQGEGLAGAGMALAVGTLVVSFALSAPAVLPVMLGGLLMMGVGGLVNKGIIKTLPIPFLS